MSMDAFTAELLLSAVSNTADENQRNEILDLSKQLQGEGPAPDAAAFFETHQGKLCRVKHTCYTGIVHKLNTSTGGFYPGKLYPIYVKITHSSESEFERAVGSVFEYALNQIELID